MADNSMIAEILRGQGAIMERLDALEKLMCDDMEEDKSEAESKSETQAGPELATNPAIHSTMLDFDIPPIF